MQFIVVFKKADEFMKSSDYLYVLFFTHRTSAKLSISGAI